MSTKVVKKVSAPVKAKARPPTPEPEEEVEEEVEEEEEEEETPPPKKKKKAPIVEEEEEEEEAPPPPKKKSTALVVTKKRPVVEEEEEEEAKPAKKKLKIEEQLTVQQPTEVAVAPKKLFDDSTWIPDTLYMTNNPADNSKEHILWQFYKDFQYFLPKMSTGEAKVRNPDLAMSLWSARSTKNFTIVEFNAPDKQFLVAKSKDYLNLKRKGGQTGLAGENFGMSLVLLSHLCSSRYFRYGLTKETGVEADLGKIAKFKSGDTPIDMSMAAYQCTVDSNVVHPQMIDEDLNNSYAMCWFNVFNAICNLTMHRMLDEKSPLFDTSLVEVKKTVTKNYTKNGKKMPTTSQEWIDALLDIEVFKWKASPNAEDPNSMELDAKANVMREIRTKEAFGRKPDDPKTVLYPTQEFVGQKKKNRKTGFNADLVINLLPCFTCNVTEEEGKASGQPITPLKPEDVAFDGSKMNFFFLLKLGFNEFTPQEACCFGCTIVGIVFHSYKDEFSAKQLSEIKAVDPRFAVPGASRYRTPKEEAARLANAAIPLDDDEANAIMDAHSSFASDLAD